MTASEATSTPAHVRAKVKCEECRRKKCKCEPRTRVWTEAIQEKCQRCLKGGQACGPNRPRRDKVPPIDIVSPTQQLPPPATPSIEGTPVVALSAVEYAASLTDPCEGSHYALKRAKYHHDGPIASFSEGKDSAVDLSCVSEPPTPSPISRHTLCRPRRERRHSLIGDKLTQLSGLLNLLDHLRHRREAALSVDAAYCPSFLPNLAVPDNVNEQAIPEAVDHYLHCAHQQFWNVLEHSLERVEDLDDVCGERLQYLLRLKILLDDFLAVTGKCGLWANGGDQSARKSQKKLLQDLEAAYVKRGAVAEASRLHRQILSLYASNEDEKNEDDTEAEILTYSSTSNQMNDLFKNLKPFTLFASHLPGCGQNLFPSTHLALMSNRNELAQRLVERSNPSDTDFLRRHAFHAAVELSDQSLLRKLIREQREKLDCRDIYQLTPLALAALQGDYDSFKALADAGANLSARDRFGRNILSMACGSGSLPITKWILAKGIDPSEAAGAMCSPLHAATSAGRDDIVKLLRDHGAQDDEGLEWAQFVFDTPCNSQTPCPASQQPDPVSNLADITISRARKILPAPQQSRQDSLQPGHSSTPPNLPVDPRLFEQSAILTQSPTSAPRSPITCAGQVQSPRQSTRKRTPAPCYMSPLAAA